MVTSNNRLLLILQPTRLVWSTYQVQGLAKFSIWLFLVNKLFRLRNSGLNLSIDHLIGHSMSQWFAMQSEPVCQLGFGSQRNYSLKVPFTNIDNCIATCLCEFEINPHIHSYHFSCINKYGASNHWNHHRVSWCQISTQLT